MNKNDVEIDFNALEESMDNPVKFYRLIHLIAEYTIIEGNSVLTED